MNSSRRPRQVRTLLCGSVLLLVTLTAWTPTIRDPATAAQMTNQQVTQLSPDMAPGTIGPVINVVDAATGRILYARDSLRRHAIGSITKLMTAWLAVHRLHLNRIVTVSGKAASTPGSSMFLVQGDQLTVRSLLYGLLIPSGNDAAEQLAETMAGNDQGFAKLANREARAIGLRCSHYVTPHGLDASGQYSCAADVATMSRLILRNYLLSHIVKTQQIVVFGAGNGEQFPLTNTNLLLGSFPGAIGVKTGTTDEAGASLTAAARRHGHVLIAVVLGSSDLGRFSDAASLLTFAFRTFIWPDRVDTMWSTASLVAGRNPDSAPIPRWESPWVRVGPRLSMTAPYDSHQG